MDMMPEMKALIKKYLGNDANNKPFLRDALNTIQARNDLNLILKLAMQSHVEEALSKKDY